MEGDRDEMHLAPIGNTVRICCVYKFYFANFFSVHRASPSNAGLFVASIGRARCRREKQNKYHVAAFCLFMRISPIDFELLGGNETH
jgi:hypothetical protein